MAKTRERNATEAPFLRVEDAEIVHGPDVVADQVSGALRDADRFDLPNVKPPLTEALDELGRAPSPRAATPDDPDEQNALECKAPTVDETAGSADLLQPGAASPPAKEP